jgi:CubicO group peptidase (beta-lactamase class C family)
MMVKNLLWLLLCLPAASIGQTIPSGAAIDAQVKKVMSNTHANGMAVAVVDKGKVGYVQAYGIRNAKGDPLTIDTVMYGASITKTVLAYTRCSWSTRASLASTLPSRTISINR